MTFYNTPPINAVPPLTVHDVATNNVMNAYNTLTTTYDDHSVGHTNSPTARATRVGGVSEFQPLYTRRTQHDGNLTTAARFSWMLDNTARFFLSL